MAAITWRNVDAPSFQGASAILTGAQQSIDSGFNKFNELIKQRETMDTANWENAKQNNTQAFLDQLSQYRTPEELKAAQESGVLNRLREASGAQIDRAGIRGAEDARYGALQQRALTNIDYGNKTLEQELRPQIQIATSLAATDKAKYDEYMANNPRLQEFMGGKLAATAVTADQAAQKLKSELASAQATQSQATAQTAAIPINAEASRIQANAAAQSARSLESQRLIDSFAKVDELAKAPTSVGVYKQGDLTAEGATDSLVKELTAAKVEPNKISNIVAAVRTLSPDGKFAIRDKDGKEVTRIPIPMTVVKDAAIQANAYSWFDVTSGPKMDKYLLKTLSSKSFQKSAQEEYEASKKKAVEQAEQVGKLRNAIYPDRK